MCYIQSVWTLLLFLRSVDAVPYCMLEAVQESSRYGDGLNWTGDDGGAGGRTVTSNGQTCGLPQSLFDVRLAINRGLKVNSDERKFDEPGLEHIKAVGRDRICWNTSSNLIATLGSCSKCNKMSAICRQLYRCQSSLLVSVSCSRYNVWEVKPNTWLAHKISVAVSFRNIQCS